LKKLRPNGKNKVFEPLFAGTIFKAFIASPGVAPQLNRSFASFTFFAPSIHVQTSLATLFSFRGTPSILEYTKHYHQVVQLRAARALEILPQDLNEFAKLDDAMAEHSRQKRCRAKKSSLAFQKGPMDGNMGWTEFRRVTSSSLSFDT
jgi:hypothetical protein